MVNLFEFGIETPPFAVTFVAFNGDAIGAVNKFVHVASSFEP